ncbi:MAG: hypothetical protein PVG93_06540 [Phycisphaerales bacterium]|jgi:hypothetical protein
MNTAPETIGQEHLKALRLNRPLLPIEQFAAREGTTVEEIEKCSNIGIVQLRRHHGKTYVVDIPICSYDVTAETDAEVASLIGKTQDIIVEPAKPETVEHKSQPKPVTHTKPASPGLFNNLCSSAKNIKTKLFKTEPKQPATQIKNDNKTVEPEQTTKKQTVEPGSISTLISKMVERSERIKQHLRQNQQQIVQTKTEPKDIPQITEQLIQQMNSQLDQMENAVEKSGILLKRNDTPRRDTTAQPVRNTLDKPRENQIEHLKVQLRQIEQELDQARKQHSETTKRLHSQIEELTELLTVMGRSD